MIDPGRPTFEPTPPTLVAPADQVRREAIVRFNDATRAWADRMLMMRGIEADLGTRLAVCRTLAEAIAVTSEWMARRVDSLVALQHHLIDIWLAYNAEGLRARLDCREPDDDARY